MTRYHRFETPLGPMYATAREHAITGIYFVGARHAPAITPQWHEAHGDALLQACARQLREYLDGRRRAFELPLAPGGTAFQARVWREIAAIGFGETLTYAQLAARAGAPGSARAAGAATGRNPLSIVVPCHRVVGSRGALTGYAGGLERKDRLLAIEGARMPALA
ncbi:MAG TPA: methylated-DNA--[protein]-cysteine S-methyltransferase [Usitatibacter sp.]|nr:methylated-DNA--[protein]-cysteine S-methyltransferase [Usitatibacter sp.]